MSGYEHVDYLWDDACEYGCESCDRPISEDESKDLDGHCNDCFEEPGGSDGYHC